ncbi:MAG: hypothetical protein WCH01_13285, partial [Methylococcaceae bacterium]
FSISLSTHSEGHSRFVHTQSAIAQIQVRKSACMPRNVLLLVMMPIKWVNLSITGNLCLELIKNPIVAAIHLVIENYLIEIFTPNGIVFSS